MNLTVQREFFRDYSLSASYVGALGRKLPASLDHNYPVYGPGATTANVNARRPYQPGMIGQARVLESIFTSDYHGLQLAAEKRGAHFSAKAYYTFSKALEDVDYQGGGLPAVQNSNRPELERARTSNDRTHVFVLSGVWRIDYLRDGSSLAKALLNGWTLSGILTQAERPAAHDHLRPRPQPRRHHQRPRRHHRRSRARHGRPQEELIEQWFNTAAFAQPALGTDGTAGRNIVDGPGFTTVDLGLFNDIRLGGSFMLQLRAEATNVFNIVNSRTRARAQRARDLRQDPHRRRHAADPAGRAADLLAHRPSPLAATRPGQGASVSAFRRPRDRAETRSRTHGASTSSAGALAQERQRAADCGGEEDGAQAEGESGLDPGGEGDREPASPTPRLRERGDTVLSDPLGALRRDVVHAQVRQLGFDCVPGLFERHGLTPLSLAPPAAEPLRQRPFRRAASPVPAVASCATPRASGRAQRPLRRA